VEKKREWSARKGVKKKKLKLPSKEGRTVGEKGGYDRKAYGGEGHGGTPFAYQGKKEEKRKTHKVKKGGRNGGGGGSYKTTKR